MKQSRVRYCIFQNTYGVSHKLFSLSIFSHLTCIPLTASKPTGDDGNRYSLQRDRENGNNPDGDQPSDKKQAKKAKKLKKSRVRGLKKGFGRFRNQ